MAEYELWDATLTAKLDMTPDELAELAQFVQWRGFHITYAAHLGDASHRLIVTGRIQAESVSNAMLDMTAAVGAWLEFRSKRQLHMCVEAEPALSCPKIPARSIAA